jgi:uncharacterized membrane protein
MASGDGDGKVSRLREQIPTDQLKQELQELAKAAGQRAMSSLSSSMGSAGKKVARTAQDKGKNLLSSLPGGGGVKRAMETGTEAVTDKAKEAVGGRGGLAKKAAEVGKDAVTDKAKEALGGGGGGSGGGNKVTNIVEEIDVGVPVSVAYNQWTRFTEFPDFMKKVEKVDQESDTELSWRAQILWSHRDWKSTIIDQVPDERIVWRSEGAKGYVDGAVTFHEISRTLTKILVTLEYYPQGLFEKVGNLWRAQGRRARLELKHFRRHVMTETILHPDEVEGWRGEIHDSEVEEDQQAGQEEPEEEDEEEEEEDEEEEDEEEEDEEEEDEEEEDEEEEEEEEDEQD